MHFNMFEIVVSLIIFIVFCYIVFSFLKNRRLSAFNENSEKNMAKKADIKDVKSDDDNRKRWRIGQILDPFTDR